MGSFRCLRRLLTRIPDDNKIIALSTLPIAQDGEETHLGIFRLPADGNLYRRLGTALGGTLLAVFGF